MRTLIFSLMALWLLGGALVEGGYSVSDMLCTPSRAAKCPCKCYYNIMVNQIHAETLIRSEGWRSGSIGRRLPDPGRTRPGAPRGLQACRPRPSSCLQAPQVQLSMVLLAVADSYARLLPAWQAFHVCHTAHGAVLLVHMGASQCDVTHGS